MGCTEKTCRDKKGNFTQNKIVYTNDTNATAFLSE